jgi:hypothetical protein
MEKLDIICGFEDNLQVLKLDIRGKFERNKNTADQKLLVIDSNIKVVDDNLGTAFEEITKFPKLMFERMIEFNINNKGFRLKWDLMLTYSYKRAAYI